MRAAEAPPPGRFAWVDAAPVKTSIYLGTVALTATRFLREGDVYVAQYGAKVFPYFFMSEAGRLRIEVSDSDLRRLAGGTGIVFQGVAVRADGRVRAVDGKATPVDATSGRLKVRIHVNRHLTLVFDSTYRLPQ